MAREVMREGKAFNGNTVRIEYDQFNLGMKYSIRYSKPGEYGFRYDSSYGTFGEAAKYFDKMISGGR